jgi:hypothetical protein
MSELQLQIIARAVKIRMERGEPLEEALGKYPKLSEAETEAIRAAMAAE